nr:septal ring lytic transglycosylase RlpA family protein [Brevibacterium renqingii]
MTRHSVTTTRNTTVGRHSAPSTKRSGSIFSALTAKKRSGRHSPDRSANTAGGVLAAVRTRPVLSAFIVPTAATAAVVASSLAMAPEDAAPGGEVIAEAPAVATAEPTKATDEFLAKAKKQAKQKPGEITIETKVETPDPEPEKPKQSEPEQPADTGGSAGGGEPAKGGSASDDNDQPSKSGESAGESGSCPMSYYGGGDGFDGRQTANGEAFDTNKLTAAHKSLPFGSKVKITNTANGKSVTVRVNDRGPYHGNRCFDLSKAAMEAVGGVGAGQINGKYEVQ